MQSCRSIFVLINLLILINNDFLDASFRQWATLRDHKVIHDPVKKFTCDICGISCARKQSLRLHMQNHLGLLKKYHCDICQKTVLYRDKRKHIQRHSGNKSHVCSVCERGFNRKDALKVHMRKHTGEKPFECSVCHKQFSQKHVLDSHMITHQVELFL